MKLPVLPEDEFKVICFNCNKREALEKHPCPYRIEMGDDAETLCTCCSECRDECAMDV